MVRSMYSLVLTTLMGLLAGVTAEAQNVKVEFVTPSIVHVVKGEATKSLVVTAKPENVAGFLDKEDVDGALVGGASLVADSFNAMIQKAAE